MTKNLLMIGYCSLLCLSTFCYAKSAPLHHGASCLLSKEASASSALSLFSEETTEKDDLKECTSCGGGDGGRSEQ